MSSPQPFDPYQQPAAPPGYRLVPNAPSGPPVEYKSSGIAYLLWFFLGGLGVHQFYLGNTNRGAIYLCLTVVGALTAVLIIGLIPLVIVGILCLVDLFTIPSQTAVANDGLYRRALTGY